MLWDPQQKMHGHFRGSLSKPSAAPRLATGTEQQKEAKVLWQRLHRITLSQ